MRVRVFWGLFVTCLVVVFLIVLSFVVCVCGMFVSRHKALDSVVSDAI
jgi:hypothetical protein